MFRLVGVINYLLVVFLNAFTDLGHKIIIQNTIFKIYNGSEQIVLIAIVNALLLLPFLVMFSPAGFLADRYPKNSVIKFSALLAIGITLFITYAYYNGLFYVAFAMTFVLALQSAIYGPAKYGYIKELVGIKYISSGNGAVQAVTTSAILIGIIFYSALFEGMLGEFSTSEDILKMIAPLGWLLVLGSIVEAILAFRLPNKQKVTSKKKFLFSKYIKGAYLKKNLLIVKRKKEIFDAIIALGLFWSISQVLLAIFGEYAKTNLNITSALVVQGIMALAVLGIVFGSILAAKLSKRYINTGLSALSSIGVFFIVISIPLTTTISLLYVEFILFGVFSGLILVPLNSKIQALSPNVHLGIILAGNNFLQTAFMFFFLVLTTIFAYLGADAKNLFYLMGVVSIYLGYILFKRYYVMAFWSFFELLLKFRHHYNYIGLENLPKNKAILLLGNHVSWVDWLVVQFPIQRRINFLIDKDIYNNKYLNPIFKKGGLIPISPKASKDSFFEASKRLKDGKIVLIFPEGGISKTKNLDKFQRGYELLDSSYDGDTVAFYIDGLFGSIFSRYKGTEKRKWWKKREITIYFSKPLPRDIKVNELKEEVLKLRKESGKK